MKHLTRVAFGALLTTVLLVTWGCGKQQETSSTGTSQAPATDVKAAAPASASESGPTAATSPSSEPKEISEPTEEVTERVAETPDGPETKEEPNKGVPPLKLAQLPPRAPAASKFKEGVNYTRLSPTQPVDVSPDQVQIVEFFWYGCPHCYAIDPRIEAWRKSTQTGGKAEYVVFTRVPGAWSDITRFHGRFYFALESLGKIDELHALIFREIHENGNPLNTIDKAREFFAAHGVDAQAFQKNFGAMSLERKLDEGNTLARRYRISGVPTFVVNGKFMLDVPSAGGEPQLIELLNELAAREHNNE
jgi:thiol:disulfide interchange protein DsbA